MDGFLLFLFIRSLLASGNDVNELKKIIGVHATIK
jgi:hypothetical protein